jgi:hypothetical protein
MAKTQKQPDGMTRVYPSNSGSYFLVKTHSSQIRYPGQRSMIYDKNEEQDLGYTDRQHTFGKTQPL